MAADYSYLAGLIDGDGCISMYRAKDKKAVSGHTYTPYMTITAKDTSFLERLQSVYGGYINISIIKSGYVNGKGTRQLRFSSNECRDILPKIIPNLILKKDEAELLLAALTITKTKCKKDYSMVETLDNIVVQLKYLKKNREVK